MNEGLQVRLRLENVASVQARLSTMGAGANKAVQLWTNWVGLEAQGEMRRDLPSRFKMRGTQALFEKAIVFQSALTSGPRKKQAILKVGSDGPGGTRASATKNLGEILARHENADVRTNSSTVYFNGRGQAMTGLGFFLPAKGLRTDTTNPSKGLYPKAIGAMIRLTPDSRLILAKGTKRGTKASGTGVSYFATRDGIFRRRHTSFGRADVEAIWWFTSRIRTPARLGLWTTAQRVFDLRGEALGHQAIDEAIFRASLP